MSLKKKPQQTGSTTLGTGEVIPSGKPPRPSRETGSLDRRRNLSSSRHERDGKSRSTHSLKEKSSSSELHKHDSMSSNLSLNSKGSFNHYNSSGSQHLHHSCPPHSHNPRLSPGIWEPPPPPPLSPWDPHYYWSYPHHPPHHQSREELRLIDYHRRQQELYQHGSNSALGSTQDLSCSSGCCSRNYYHYPPAPPCCSMDHHRPQWNNDVQRQDTDERLRRLQKDKESLALQVKTLTEQIQSQSTKLSELENMIKEKNQLLSNAEDLLQREMLSRSSLETQKLELMSAMSELKLQQAALERENLELRTNFVTNTVGSAALINGGLTNGNGSGATITNVLNNNSITSSLLRRPQIITNTRMVGMSPSAPGASLISSPIHHGSHGSLPQTAISPITPKTPPASYRQRIDVHYSSLPRQAFATTLSTVSTSSGSSTTTDSNANPKRIVAFGKCSPSLDTYFQDSCTESKQAADSFCVQLPDANRRAAHKSDRNSLPLAVELVSDAISGSIEDRKNHNLSLGNIQPNQKPVVQNSKITTSTSMNALLLAAALQQRTESNLKNMKSASASAQELAFDSVTTDQNDLARTKSEVHRLDNELRQQERANTEPPSPTLLDDEPKASRTVDENAPNETMTSSGMALTSDTLLRLKLPRSKPDARPKLGEIDKLRGFSVPNLAETENRDIGSSDQTEGVNPTRSYTPQPSPSPSMSNKLKTIFGKIKRSNSGTLDDMTASDGEFKRGGVRATAGARLGWSGTTQYRKPDKPFQEWDLDAVCLWFDHLGLSIYEEELRRWLKPSLLPGSELMKASPVDFEKELPLRNPLHRKKIVLAIADFSGTANDDELIKCAGKLDTSWVQRWLDDIGMPQYKDTFIAARMDGRMLHKLTMDDLVHLQMSSCLHVASIRRAIQLMRSEKWNPDCLIRRPLQVDFNAKDDVRLWSAQRVHEWLRAVDLAEYAPNLRGSGVHGALMIFEVKFTAELFADLLNIPSSKTLLRRHLATHFKDLLGRDIIQVKREAENTLGFQPLTVSAKIKTPKKSQFSLKRKKSNKGGQLGGEEWSDYVCPMGGSGQEHLTPATSMVYAATSTKPSSNNPNAASAFTSNASSANTNIVTSIGMTKDLSTVQTACPDNTLSITNSTTTSGVGSEHASLHRQPSSSSSQLMTTASLMNNGIASGGGGSSDSPLSRLFSCSISSTASSPVLSSLLMNNNRSLTTDNDNNPAFTGNVIASFSPVKDVYPISSVNHSTYSSSSSLVSNNSSKKQQSSTVTLIGKKLTEVTSPTNVSRKQANESAAENDASNIPVQRSSSFNSACTVPLSICKTVQVKNSASFGNCSILSKVAKKSSVLTTLTTNPLLKFTSNSATNLLKHQTTNVSSSSANSISYQSNITETLANAGSNNHTQTVRSKSAAGGSLSSSTGQIPSPSMNSISSSTSTVANGLASSISSSPIALNQSTSVTALSLAQLKNNSIVDYYV
uniref:SAM domain-containing protein n=1 Tax=Anopheles minimus TaxID=112268 RepID=A0A182W862_9DIPT